MGDSENDMAEAEWSLLITEHIAVSVIDDRLEGPPAPIVSRSRSAPRTAWGYQVSASAAASQQSREIRGELLHIWGRQDPHVPLEGRNRIKASLEEAQVNFQWIELNGAHAFMRDEGYRYDPASAHLCYGWVFELLHRRLALARTV